MRKISWLTLFVSIFWLMPYQAGSAQENACAANEVAHVIQRGENLFRISLRYGVSQSTIAQRNSIINPARIFAGVTLCIPAGVDSGISSSASGTASETETIETTTTTTAQTTVSTSTNTASPHGNGNWCNPGGPWENKCSITDDLSLRNLLWRCGWYFARGLTSDECGSPPPGPRMSASEIAAAGVDAAPPATAPPNYSVNTSGCTVEIGYAGDSLPSDWSLSQAFAAVVLALEDAGCSSFTATFSGSVVLQGNL